jgi:protein FAM32A
MQDRKKKRKVAKGGVQDEESAKASPSGSGRNSPAIPGASDERKTSAEKRFQEVQRQRVSFQSCGT